jgi:hypothetical protein
MYEATLTASQAGQILGCIDVSLQLQAPGAGAFAATSVASAGT